MQSKPLSCSIGFGQKTQRNKLGFHVASPLAEFIGVKQEGASLPLTISLGQYLSFISTAASVPRVYQVTWLGVSLPWAQLKAGTALSLLIMWRIYITYINISLCTGIRVAFMEGGRLGAARLHHCWRPVQCCHSLSPQSWEGPVKKTVRWDSASWQIDAFRIRHWNLCSSKLVILLSVSCSGPFPRHQTFRISPWLQFIGRMQATLVSSLNLLDSTRWILALHLQYGRERLQLQSDIEAKDLSFWPVHLFPQWLSNGPGISSLVST